MSSNNSMPSPPDDLAQLELPSELVGPDQLLWRIYDRGKGYDIFHYRRDSAARFCDPNEEFGVLYVSASPIGAFVETIVRDFKGTSVVDKYIAPSKYSDKRLGRLVPEREMKLVDLRASIDLDRLRISKSIHSSNGYDVTRLWARAFWEHPDEIDGILYPSRHGPDGHPSIAVFEDRFPASDFIHPDSKDQHIRPDDIEDEIIEYTDNVNLGWEHPS